MNKKDEHAKSVYVHVWWTPTIGSNSVRPKMSAYSQRHEVGRLGAFGIS